MLRLLGCACLFRKDANGKIYAGTNLWALSAVDGNLEFLNIYLWEMEA